MSAVSAITLASNGGPDGGMSSDETRGAIQPIISTGMATLPFSPPVGGKFCMTLTVTTAYPCGHAGCIITAARRGACMIRTGEEYRAGLRDGREVWIDGERVADVTAHPAFKPIVDAKARLYDMAP